VHASFGGIVEQFAPDPGDPPLLINQPSRLHRSSGWT
jgi:hypothetical protein